MGDQHLYPSLSYTPAKIWLVFIVIKRTETLILEQKSRRGEGFCLSPGIWSIYSILVLIILVCTGWLSDLSKQLKITRSQLIGGLCLVFLCHFLPTVDLSPSYELTPGIIGIIGISLLLMDLVNRSRMIVIYIKIVFLGTGLFVFHELAHVQTDWTDLSFRMVVISAVTLLPVFRFKQFHEQLLMQLGSLLYLHFLILAVYADMLAPLPIGQKTFLDTCWLSIGYLLTIHYGLKSFFGWRKMQTNGNR